MFTLFLSIVFSQWVSYAIISFYKNYFLFFLGMGWEWFLFFGEAMARSPLFPSLPPVSPLFAAFWGWQVLQQQLPSDLHNYHLPAWEADVNILGATEVNFHVGVGISEPRSCFSFASFSTLGSEVSKWFHPHAWGSCLSANPFCSCQGCLTSSMWTIWNRFLINIAH